MASFAHAKNDMRPVRILYHKAPKDAPKNAYIYMGDKLIANPNLTKHNFSKTFEIPKGDTSLKFLPNELEEGTKPAKGAPSIKIPATWQKILLLVYLDEKNNVMPIKVKGINASDDVFGPGSTYIINFSEVLIKGNIGNKEISIHPKKFKVIDFPASKSGAYPVILQKVIKGDNTSRDFIKTMWQQAKTTRQVLLIIPREAPYHASYFNAPIRSF